MPRNPDESQAGASTVLAYCIHALTASGMIFSFLAVRELMQPNPAPRWVLVWLGVTLVIDMVDGPLARRFDVKARAPRIDGRALDDIIDYLTFTFIPLLMVWWLGWLPGGGSGVNVPGAPGLLAGLLTALAMTVSLFGFTNTQAKQESEGFFLGFPSYWNLYAVYAGLFAARGLVWFNALVLVSLVILTVAPIRFVYPNLAPHPWYWPLTLGGLAWGAVLVGMLPWYPADVPAWLAWVTLAYPVFYLAISWTLDWKQRQNQ